MGTWKESIPALSDDFRGDREFPGGKHAYTHFRITLHAFRCRMVAGEPRCLDCAAFRWATLDELDALPMSVVDRKVALALSQIQERM